MARSVENRPLARHLPLGGSGGSAHCPRPVMRRALHQAIGAAALSAALRAPFPAGSAEARVAGRKSVDDILSLDVVHLIEIRADPTNLHFLDEDRSVKVSCEVTIDGERYADANFTEKGSIGSSSTLAGKPGFNIRFGKERPTGMKKLTINNSQQDVTFLHEHLAYELYRRGGMAAPRTAHGLMTLNERPYGLYVMVEPKDDLFLERSFGKDNAAGNLYDFNVSDFVDNLYDPTRVALEDSDDESSDVNREKRADLQALADVVRGAANDELAAAIGLRLDLDQFIAAYAIDSLMAHWDGPIFNTNNYYLYDKPADGRFVLLPHGADQVFDSTYDPLTPPTMLLARRIRAIPELDRQLRDAMNWVMSDVWIVDVLMARIAQVRKVLGAVKTSDAAAARDISWFQDFGAGVGEQLDARKARWLRQPF